MSIISEKISKNPGLSHLVEKIFCEFEFEFEFEFES